MKKKIAVLTAFACWTAMTPPAFAGCCMGGNGARALMQECFAPADPSPQHILMICQKVIDETIYDGEPFIYASMGVARIRMGDFKQAIVNLSYAISISGKDYRYLPDAYRYRCFANLDSGRLQDALSDCNTSLSLQPNNVSALDFRGDVEYRLRDYKAATADFDNVLSRDPKQWGSQYVRGLARMRNGDTGGGQADIAAAEAADPDVAREYIGFDKQT
jgi:tetratricopeptide (TPR) repeat protein